MPDHIPPQAANDDDIAQDRLQRRLAELNRRRFTPALPAPDWEEDIGGMAELQLLEGRFLETRRAAVAARAATAPTDPDGFVAWFAGLERDGPGQGDPLFPWLATRASRAEMCWFLTQEVAGEAGFDDLAALTQMRMPVRPKLEIARNYWDEMGRGNAKGMHGPMLEHLATRLGLQPRIETTVWESLALANVMAGLAANRRFAYQAVGALGIVEQTAPGRSAQVAAGLKRLGVPAGDRHYFALHAVLDVKHAAAWNAEAIWPLVAEDPRHATAIAEGALMRLECGAACFRRYRRELGLETSRAAA
jgi:hypothetical protein